MALKSGIRGARYHGLLLIGSVKNTSPPDWAVPNLYRRPVVSQRPVTHNPSHRVPGSKGRIIFTPGSLGAGFFRGHIRAAQLTDSSYLAFVLRSRLRAGFRFTHATYRSAKPSDLRQHPGLHHAKSSQCTGWQFPTVRRLCHWHDEHGRHVVCEQCGRRQLRKRNNHFFRRLHCSGCFAQPQHHHHSGHQRRRFLG